MTPEVPLRLDYLDDMLVRRISTMVFLAKEFPKSPGYYRDAGLALLMLREGKSGVLWARIIRTYCKLGPRRAYQLMELAAGKSLEALRRRTSAAVKNHRKNKWLTTKAPRRKRPKRGV